jgi:hypothetical protein
MASTQIFCTKDASAHQESNGWSGWDDHHPVGTAANNNTWRCFLYFPISFTGWTGINSATLWLRGHESAGLSHIISNQTRSMVINRMTADWGEGTDRGENVWSTNELWTWNNRANAYSLINETQTPTISGGITHGDWYSFDVTDIVRDWFDGVGPNYGFIIRASTEADGQIGLHFYARDVGENFRPYLIIDYDTNTAPDAPTGLSPNTFALVNSLTPTLVGTRSDIDSGDYISAFQIKLYDNALGDLIWDSGTLLTTGTPTTFSKVYAGPSLEGGTVYKWHARTRDKGGLWGPYASTVTFTTNTPPDPPYLTVIEKPMDDLTTLNPTISVTHRDNDASDTKMYGYTVNVYDNGVLHWGSGDIDTSSSPIATLLLPYGGPALSWGHEYDVRARTKDAAGVWGATSINLRIRTHETGVPIPVDPILNEQIAALVPTFQAQKQDDVDTIVSYQIILYDVTANSQQIWDSGVLTTGITNGSAISKVYDGTALQYNRTYSWKIRVTGQIGGTSSYTALQTFVTPVDSSAPFVNLPTPNNSPTNQNVTSLTPTITGGRSTNFTDYNIQLYPASSTSSSLGTPIWDSGTLTQASAATFSKVYNGPSLSWGTTYKVRVRVGSPTLGAWSGLTAFTIDSAGQAVATAPADNAWLTTATPAFSGTTAVGDLAIARRVRVFDADTGTLIWDSGDLSQGSSSTLSSVTYAGTALAGGKDYNWQIRYTKSTGAFGAYSVLRTFRLNGAPQVPSELLPSPGHVYGGGRPTFQAKFEDPDQDKADYPTLWTIEIRNNATDALLATKNISTNLTTELNVYAWQASDTTIVPGTEYKWRTRFTDSKGAVGAYSSYRTFLIGTPPTIDIISPSNGSNINTTRPIIDWTYSSSTGRAQAKFIVTIQRVDNDTNVYTSGTVVSAESQFRIPTGYLRDGFDYDVFVRVYDVDGLASNTDTVSISLFLDAPPRVEGLSATIYEDRSKIYLEWDASSLGTNFVSYVIYRRNVGDTEWGMIGTRKPETLTAFSDWYSGQREVYEYRVTVVKKIADEPDLESPDSDIVQAQLSSDEWMVIGHDRAEEHTFGLPVMDAPHQRPVQQEVFEPLGSNRKAVIRGFVLGHEGSLECLWAAEEASLAKEQIEYLLQEPGPHILKSPFGDVWDVTFSSPDFNYAPVGHMPVTLEWIETGHSTSNPFLTPDDYLAQIGAE